jgi:hypothetical protein
MSAMMTLRRLLILAAALVVSGCYLPNEFTADLRITPDGNYNFTYDGRLTYLPLLDKLDKGQMSQEESTESVKVVAQDLARDKGFQEITYASNATFVVRYKRIGNIRAEKSFTFVRLTSRLLSIESRKDGTINIFGDKPNTEDAKRIEATGIVMRGTLRIQTEAQVMRQNATEVLQVKPAVYVWKIDGVEKASPQLLLAGRQ